MKRKQSAEVLVFPERDLPPRKDGWRSFKVEPVVLSPEHAKQAERFQGFPYDPIERAALQGWIAFKRWHQKELDARDGPREVIAEPDLRRPQSPACTVRKIAV